MKRIAALALAGAIALSVSGVTAIQGAPAVVQAAEATNSPAVQVTCEKSEDTVTVTLSWNKQQFDKFAYAVVYDTSTAAVSSRALDPEFLEQYTAIMADDEMDQEPGNSASVVAIKDFEQYGYVTLGGAYANKSDTTPEYTGAIATITFKKAEGAETFGKIKIIKNTDDNIKYPTSESIANAESSQVIDLDTGKAEAPVIGNVNGDNFVNAKDAVQILRYAAKLSSTLDDMSEDERMLRGNVNNDRFVNAKDAVQILRYAAKLSSDLDQVYPRD